MNSSSSSVQIRYTNSFKFNQGVITWFNESSLKKLTEPDSIRFFELIRKGLLCCPKSSKTICKSLLLSTRNISPPSWIQDANGYRTWTGPHGMITPTAHSPKVSVVQIMEPHGGGGDNFERRSRRRFACSCLPASMGFT